MTSSDTAAPARSWMDRCGPRAKLGIMVFLLASFALQTHLVYSDPSPGPLLTPAARAGRRIWHQRNCQSCHQLYGFGGFIGPDLTNAARRVSATRLRRLLREGSGRMPAFDLNDDEVTAVSAFLEAMDATGQGEARLDPPAAGDTARNRALLDAIGRALKEDGASASLRRGHELFLSRACQSCHLPVAPISTPGPDLLGVRYRLTDAQILAVLEHGRPPDMPPPALSEQEREIVRTFLRWLGRNQSRISRDARADGIDHRRAWRELPWWEFDR